MLKKTLLLSLIFSTTALLAEELKVICEAHTSEENRMFPLILEFMNSKLKTAKFDANSKKSALEQYLDHGFNSDYRKIQFLFFTQKYQYGCEYLSECSQKLHEELLTSDLLVAAVYRELFAEKDNEISIHDAGKYGFWKCMPSCNKCVKFTQKNIKEILDPSSEIINNK